MLYVIPPSSQENITVPSSTQSTLSPQRTLTTAGLHLDLNPQYDQTTTVVNNINTSLQMLQQDAGNVLNREVVVIDSGGMATDESCDDERTHLISGSNRMLTTQQRQSNANNNKNANGINNNLIIKNNQIHNVRNENDDGGIGDIDVTIGDDTEVLSDAAADTTIGDSDISDKLPQSTQSTQQQQQQQQQQLLSKKSAKLTKLGTKSIGLKRVSFGSSKGSMVETLVFETPTPLSEHVEPTFGFETDLDTHTTTTTTAAANKVPTNYHTYSKVNLDDSGIDVQGTESERSIVRVSIYQSSQPQQICPPEYFTRLEDNLDNTTFNYNNYNIDEIMTAVSTIPGYDRQQSTDSGWDNPFRPGGDLSREADEIVNLIKGGKPITPTEDHSIVNGGNAAQRQDICNGSTTITTTNDAGETVTKTIVTQNQSSSTGGGGGAAQNGTNALKTQQQSTIGGKSTDNSATAATSQVSKQVVPGPTSASHVVIDEKKNKKKGCCVVQ